jgi:hypothetical protein
MDKGRFAPCCPQNDETRNSEQCCPPGHIQQWKHFTMLSSILWIKDALRYVVNKSIKRETVSNVVPMPCSAMETFWFVVPHPLKNEAKSPVSKK